MKTGIEKRASRKRSKAQENPPAAGPPPEWRITEWIRNHSRLTLIILIALGTARIVATYPVFNHTIDEPAHLACGMEWLDRGVYRYEAQHPPLARVMAALGPFLAGVRTQERVSFIREGAAVLYFDGKYDRNLVLARLGILPFFWLAALVTWFWARRYFGEPTAAIAVLLFTFVPTVLAHAGLATTDMALTATVGAAFISGIVWLESPTLAASLLFGFCTGLACLAKFSALPFLAAAFLGALACYLAIERPGVKQIVTLAQRRFLPLALAMLTTFLVIWAGYRFSYGKVYFADLRLPFPEFYDGIRSVIEHNDRGHTTYLLGKLSDTGWWYYYPVLILFKTPLALLALLAFGVATQMREAQSPWKNWLPVAFSGGILLFALFSRINIGLRHILPVYIGFSIIAAIGAVRLLEMSRTVNGARWTLGLLLLWYAGSSLLSHPDYIPYFNELAGSEPEWITVDSDLDWGQDMKRLARRLNEVGAPRVTFNPFIVADLQGYHGFPLVYETDPKAPGPGWTAVSLSVLKLTRLGLYHEHPEIRPWPDVIKPAERVGKSVYLYYYR